MGTDPVSPADTIRRALGHLEEWDGISPAQVEDEEAACRALDALLAVGERDRQRIAQRTEALERIADPMTANLYAAQYRADALRQIAAAVLADKEDAAQPDSCPHGHADWYQCSDCYNRAAGEGDT